MHLSLVTRDSLLISSKYESHCKLTCLSLATNTFHAWGKHFRYWRQMHFMLKMNTSTGEACVENVRLHFSHTHSYSYQRLSSRIYVEVIAEVTAIDLRNGYFHIEEIQTVSRCTTTSSVALNRSSRPSK